VLQVFNLCVVVGLSCLCARPHTASHSQLLVTLDLPPLLYTMHVAQGPANDRFTALPRPPTFTPDVHGTLHTVHRPPTASQSVTSVSAIARCTVHVLLRAPAQSGPLHTSSSHLLFTPPLSTPLHRCRRSPRPLLVAAHTRLVRLRRLDYRDARFHGRRTDHRPRGGGHDFPLCARSPPITLRARVSSRTRLLSHTSLPRTSLTPAPASLLAHEPPAPASFLAYGRPTHAVVQSTPHIQCHAAAGTSCVCVRAYCRCATSL
jgi:hypothetical protein